MLNELSKPSIPKRNCPKLQNNLQNAEQQTAECMTPSTQLAKLTAEVSHPKRSFPKTAECQAPSMQCVKRTAECLNSQTQLSITAESKATST